MYNWKDKMGKVGLCVGLVFSSQILIKKTSTAFGDIEEKVLLKEEEKEIEKQKKEMEKQEEKDREDAVKKIEYVENKMIKNILLAEKYMSQKGSKIEDIGRKNNINLYTIPDKTGHTFYESEEVIDYKGESFERIAEIKWLTKIDRYSSEKIPVELKDVVELGSKKYGAVKEQMNINVTIPDISLESYKSDNVINFIVDYINIDEKKVTVDEFVDRINKESELLLANYSIGESPVEKGLLDWNIDLKVWDSGMEIKYCSEDYKFIKEPNSISDFELTFGSKLEMERKINSLDGAFYKWKEEKAEREYLYHDNINGWGEESQFFIGVDVNDEAIGETKPEYLKQAMPIYTKALSEIYDFLNEEVYLGKYPVSKAVFCERIISSGLKAGEDEYFEEEAFPGIYAVAEVHQTVMNRIGGIRIYFDFPSRIK